MPRTKRAVESSLKKKGFELMERDHRYFVYRSMEGHLTEAGTKTSHGSKPRDIPDGLLSRMAKQVKLTSRRQFEDLIDCPMEREDYEALLREKGILPSG